MKLGEIIKSYRTQNNISMDEFSKRSGLSKSYIAMLEKNINPSTGKEITPTIEAVNKAAKAMHLDFDNLISAMRDSEVKLTNAREEELISSSPTSGENLRLIRKRKGLTINDVLRAINSLTEKELIFLESFHNIDTQSMTKLSKCYNVSRDNIIKYKFDSTNKSLKIAANLRYLLSSYALTLYPDQFSFLSFWNYFKSVTNNDWQLYALCYVVTHLKRMLYDPIQQDFDLLSLAFDIDLLTDFSITYSHFDHSNNLDKIKMNHMLAIKVRRDYNLSYYKYENNRAESDKILNLMMEIDKKIDIYYPNFKDAVDEALDTVRDRMKELDICSIKTDSPIPANDVFINTYLSMTPDEQERLIMMCKAAFPDKDWE